MSTSVLTPAPSPAAISGRPPAPNLFQGVGFGLELEFFTVAKNSFAPVDCHHVLAEHPGYGRSIKGELAREQIEIATQPHRELDTLEAEAAGLINEVSTLLDSCGARLLPAALFDQVPLTLARGDRYSRLRDRLGPAFQRYAPCIAADQVNIGAANQNQAIRIYNEISYYLSEFMSFAAASPLAAGALNGIASNRMAYYDAALTAAPGLSGFPELAPLPDAELPVPCAAIPEVPYGYRYCRFMPHRGVAAEIRCIDKQPTLRDTMSFVALAKAIAAKVIRTPSFCPLGSDELSWRRQHHDAGRRRFMRARRSGIYDIDGHGSVLESLAGFLSPKELRYLGPLADKLKHGAYAQQMRRWRPTPSGFWARLASISDMQ